MNKKPLSRMIDYDDERRCESFYGDPARWKNSFDYSSLEQHEYNHHHPTEDESLTSSEIIPNDEILPQEEDARHMK